MNRLLLFLTLMAFGHSDIFAKTLTVSQDGSGDFNLIWPAIQTAEEGDTVFVEAGNYGGPGLPIDKNIILKGAGADRTTLSFALTAFAISADQAVIEGFDILANGEGRSLTLAIGINDCSPTIRQNIIRGAHTAIEINGQGQPVIQENEIHGLIGIELNQATGSIDARFNWWGTDKEEEILKKIKVEGDGQVDFTPWLMAPNEIQPAQTLISPKTFGAIKRIFEQLQ